MKTIWRDIWAGITMGFLVPGLILNFAAGFLPGQGEKAPITAQSSSSRTEQDCVYGTEALSTQPSETEASAMSGNEDSFANYEILLHDSPDGVTRQAMQTYILCVVLGEMPAWFEEDALMAQAVVARTYTAKAIRTGGKHGDGGVCTQPGCCQAYLTPEAYLQHGGTTESLEKVRRAVAETAGYILCYQGQPIEATYFSCSGGKTEDAVAVWGTDYPYLRSVNSPGEENADVFAQTKDFTLEEFAASMGISPAEVRSGGIGAAEYTAGGGIARIMIGQQLFTGTELRRKLDLRSTAMTITVQEQTVQITTRGYGHRVGMSQYGADAMAASGASWEQILLHYYPGTQLQHYDPNP